VRQEQQHMYVARTKWSWHGSSADSDMWTVERND